MPTPILKQPGIQPENARRPLTIPEKEKPMAYPTTFNLDWEDPEPTIGQITDKLTAISDNHLPGDTEYPWSFQHWKATISGEEEHSWYDFHEHMTIISSTWPAVLFTLNGRGDDRDDNWKAFYLNGKSAFIQAVLVYPEFNPDTLRQPDQAPETPPVLEEQIQAIEKEASASATIKPDTLATAKDAFRTMYGHAPRDYRIGAAGPEHIAITAKAKEGSNIHIIFGPLNTAISVSTINGIPKTTRHTRRSQFPEPELLEQLDEIRLLDLP